MHRRITLAVLFLVLSVFQTHGFDDPVLGRLDSSASSVRSLKSAVTTSNGGEDPQSGKTYIVGGRAMSTPCCVSWEVGRVDCFIRGPNSTVLHMMKSAGKYGNWVDIGGEVIGYVECVSRRTGLVELLGQGKDNSLQWTSYDGAAWSEWKSLGGTIREAPSCVVGADARVDCNTRDKGGRLLYARSLKEGKWAPLRLASWEFHSPVKCLQRQDNQYNCWGSSPVNQFRNVWRYTAGSWGGGDLVKFPEKIKSQPSACGWNDGSRCDIFMLGIQNQLMHIHVLAYGVWQPFEDLGGTFESTPQCVSNNVDTIHCIGVGIDSKLHRRSYEGGKWSEWISGWGSFLDGQYCLWTAKEELSCYMRSFEKAVVEVIYALK